MSGPSWFRSPPDVRGPGNDVDTVQCYACGGQTPEDHARPFGTVYIGRCCSVDADHARELYAECLEAECLEAEEPA